MPGFLRQATASQSRALGPFLDSTDFLTPETGLTIANTDIQLVVNGAASADKSSGGGTHRVNGVYGVTFDATDTATVGEMEVSIVVSGALPVFDKFFVIEEAVYDALFAAGAAGYQAPIWAAANSTVNLSGTTVKTATDVATLIGATGSGLTSLATQASVNTIAGYLDTEIAAILAAVDTEVAAIKAKTDLIPGTTDGKTFAQLTTLIAAVLLGKASGLETTTAVYRAVDDSKARVTATVDGDGNRSAVTLDAA
jgi:hypothetical protein